MEKSLAELSAITHKILAEEERDKYGRRDMTTIDPKVAILHHANGSCTLHPSVGRAMDAAGNVLGEWQLKRHGDNLDTWDHPDGHKITYIGF